MQHILSSNHPIITRALEVVELCAPLQQNFNTSYFNFVRRYVDGSEACLTTDPVWTQYFYTNQLYTKVMSDQFARNKSVLHRIKIIPWTQFVESLVIYCRGKSIMLAFAHYFYQRKIKP